MPTGAAPRHRSQHRPVTRDLAAPLWRRAGSRARQSRTGLFLSLEVLAWTGVGVALFVLLERISMRGPMIADGASNALQGWEMLHGNLLLHGWVLDDANYYTFELPIYAIAESLIGLGAVDIHVVGALTYLIVVALAVALARADSRGLSAAARSGAVIAVLAAPLVLAPGVVRLVEEPDHIGTSAAYMLGAFLLICRAAGRRITAPLACLILGAGQIGDPTVRYIAVPAVLMVCGYRIFAARRLRTYDTAVAVAAVASVPLSLLARAVMRHLGSYVMVLPRTGIAPIGLWPHRAVQAVVVVIDLFGVPSSQPRSALDYVAALFVFACLLAAAAGFVRVAWTWRTASRAEQMLCTAIVTYLAAYVVSTYGAPREIAALLPCGAVLAARACVPRQIASRPRAWAVLTAAVLAAVLPLAAAAAQPPVPQPQAQIAAWLTAHHLRYGLASFGTAATVTVQSAGQVQVRAIQAPGTRHQFGAGYRQAKSGWYKPSLHSATFVIARRFPREGQLRAVERFFGRPAAIYYLPDWIIVRYSKNLLVRVASVPRTTLGRPAVG